jgi:hypothetical protein
MLSIGANVIIWCYHVILSSGMITPSYFIFPENFTHSADMENSYLLLPENFLGFHQFKIKQGSKLNFLMTLFRCAGIIIHTPFQLIITKFIVLCSFLHDNISIFLLQII